MKELRKGIPAPYHGYLLGVKEYEAYKQFQKTAPLLQDFIKEEKIGGKRI